MVEADDEGNALRASAITRTVILGAKAMQAAMVIMKIKDSLRVGAIVVANRVRKCEECEKVKRKVR